jgi:hypothetical protein
MQEEDDRKRTLVSGLFKVKLQVLLPSDVLPLYVVQVIVQVPDAPAVHQESGIIHFTVLCAVFVAIVSDFPFQEAISV